jgi:UDP-3-O-[3-hydroxymyristoyl] N-acetylglucosamine deacetylase
MRLKPAARDTGIVFYRTDKGVTINASVSEVSDTAFATTLGNGKGKIKTVEHILAAVSGLGIDNLRIEISGPEVPILDGSAAGFVGVLKSCGVVRQASNRPYLRITSPVVFKEGKVEIAVMPYEGRRISYQIDFNHHMLGQQQFDIDLDEASFTDEIAPARTFGFAKDVEYLRSMGLVKGGSLDNAILLDDNGVVNSSGLRYEDEFIRHKVLDFIGDTSLAGFPIYGHFIVNRSGHSTNVKFLKKLLASPECWELVTDINQTLSATA